MQNLYALTRNYILTCAVLSWIIAQIIKTILTLITTQRFEAERLVGAGGMPSAHSALVCSMTLAVARREGFASSIFALTLMFAAVVMYDAMGVRRAAGEQAKVLNKIVISFKRNEDKGTQEPPQQHQDKIRAKRDKGKFIKLDDMQFKKLKEYLGHTPLEVLAGALLGIIIAMIIPMS
ncbi:MAG: divergent PAP2 family protein [Acetanaerobacterium sp.]